MVKIKLVGDDHDLPEGTVVEGTLQYQVERAGETISIYDYGGERCKVWVVPDEDFARKYRESYAGVYVDEEEEEEERTEGGTFDPVTRPEHYNSHPSGVEAITITRHYVFAVGNAIKYLWRAGLKRDTDLEDKEKEIQDLEKAKWYIEDRIKMLKGEV